MCHRMLSRLPLLFFILCALAVAPHIACAREVKVDKDVAYGTVQQTKLLLDVYEPSGFTGKRPGLVLIHGGGFLGGDKSFYAPLGKKWAEKGYVVFSLNYRLLPMFRYPAQVDDVQRAVRWARAHADDYNLDPDRIGALGDSAGGYLVTMLGLRDTRDNSDPDLAKYSSRVQCVVDLYGPTDFTIPAAKAGVDPQLIALVALFFGKSQDQAPDLYREGSPVTYVSKQSAPFLILQGTTDTTIPADQSQRLCDALTAAGVDTTLVLFYKYGHGFLKPGDPQQTGLLADDFFARHLKP